MNPDLEIGRLLTETIKFPNTPKVLGALEYETSKREPATVAILEEYVENEGDAWNYTLDYLSRFFERAAAKTSEIKSRPRFTEPLPEYLDDEPPVLVRELMGLYMDQMKLLGQRTAELHIALASGAGGHEFAPQPFTHFYRQSQFQAMRSINVETLRLLNEKIPYLRETTKKRAEKVLSLESDIIDKFRDLRNAQLTAQRIRIHGDYRLRKALYTGKDFFIVDFQREPGKTISERRNKSSAIQDIAGMLRSIQYASFTAMFDIADSASPLDKEDMEPWRKLWYRWAGIAFLKQYLTVSDNAIFIPENQEELQILLDAYIMEKMIYELRYELNNRPEWAGIPLRGIIENMTDGMTTSGE